MTINKSQGQSFENVGIYLPTNVFSHGHLYVAFSRCTSKANIKVKINDVPNKQGKLIPGSDRVFTTNVVYPGVFSNTTQDMPSENVMNQNFDYFIDAFDDEAMRPVHQNYDDENMNESIQLCDQIGIEEIELPDQLEFVELADAVEQQFEYAQHNDIFDNEEIADALIAIEHQEVADAVLAIEQQEINEFQAAFHERNNAQPPNLQVREIEPDSQGRMQYTPPEQRYNFN